MKLSQPQIIGIEPIGIWTGRKPRAVFVRKHNLEHNLEAAKDETKSVTSLSAQDWLFLLEGYKKYHSVENQFLDGLVEDLDIQAEDPIINPFSSEVAEAASIEKMTSALSVLVMDYLDLITENGIEQLKKEILEVIFNQNLDSVANSFGVSPKILRREFSKLKWRNEQVLNQQLLNLAEKRKLLIDKSNSQSKVKVGEILIKYEQPNLFIMSGIEHATIFTQQQGN